MGPKIDPSDPATWPDPDEEPLAAITEEDRAYADEVGNGNFDLEGEEDPE